MPQTRKRTKRTVVPPEDQAVLLTRVQMAALLNIGVSTLDRWAAEPGFPVIRGPRMVRFERDSVLEYVKRMALMGREPPNRAGEGGAAYAARRQPPPVKRKTRR